MGTAGKIFAWLATAVLVLVLGLSLFIRLYLTEDRLKALVIPPLSSSLDRRVTMDGIQAGLFSGITVNHLAVKEKDGRTDFVTADAFILRYRLLPLLQKKVVVREVSLVNPRVRIHRDRTGKFNFESLAVLGPSPAPAGTSPGKPTTGTALPLALTVNQVQITNARFSFDDALRKLPSVTAQSDLRVALDIGRDLSRIHYQGSLNFTADAVHGKAKPHLRGTGIFDQDSITVKAEASLDGQKVAIDSMVRNYLARPGIECNIASESLDVDRLLAIMAGLPAAGKKSVKKERPEAAPPIPAALSMHGTVRIGQTVYKKLTMHDLSLRYAIKNRVLSINDFTARTAGGKLVSEAEINLAGPETTFKGRIGAQALQARELRLGLFPEATDGVNGVLESALTFSGAGTTWPRLSKSLTGEGSYALRQALIRNTEITRAAAALLGLPQLNDLSLKDVSGTVRLEQGKAVINTGMTGKDVRVTTRGSVGLDGTLDLPLTIRLSKELGRKIGNRSISRFLEDADGWTAINLKLSGTIWKPRLAINTGRTGKQLQKTIEQRALKEIERALPKEQGGPNPALDLLKGILGR